jgi:DNA-directed RNA polymerase specialized sigma24 family protein
MGNQSGLSVSAAEARSADGREEEHPSPEPGESAALAASVARGRRADSEVARGLDGEPEQSPSEIAQRLGLSTARVREIERRARGKLAAAARTAGADADAEADAVGGDCHGQEPRRTS